MLKYGACVMHNGYDLPDGWVEVQKDDDLAIFADDEIAAKSCSSRAREYHVRLEHGFRTVWLIPEEHAAAGELVWVRELPEVGSALVFLALQEELLMQQHQIATERLQVRLAEIRANAEEKAARHYNAAEIAEAKGTR
jgi:hypothetical protein